MRIFCLTWLTKSVKFLGVFVILKILKISQRQNLGLQNFYLSPYRYETNSSHKTALNLTETNTKLSLSFHTFSYFSTTFLLFCKELQFLVKNLKTKNFEGDSLRDEEACQSLHIQEQSLSICLQVYLCDVRIFLCQGTTKDQKFGYAIFTNGFNLINVFCYHTELIDSSFQGIFAKAL